jgi:hypothetical protein
MESARMKPDPKEEAKLEHARRTMDSTAFRRFLNEGLARKIAGWARHHKECRHMGCRRNARCLKPGNCLVVRDRPPMTDEQRLALGRKVRAALDQRLKTDPAFAAYLGVRVPRDP